MSVQTEEEMKAQLLDLGLGDSVLDAGDGRVIEGEQMAQLARTLAAMEDSLVALERRGVSQCDLACCHFFLSLALDPRRDLGIASGLEFG